MCGMGASVRYFGSEQLGTQLQDGASTHLWQLVKLRRVQSSLLEYIWLWLLPTIITESSLVTVGGLLGSLGEIKNSQNSIRKQVTDAGKMFCLTTWQKSFTTTARQDIYIVSAHCDVFHLHFN